MKPGNRYHHGQLREALLDAAEVLLDEGGVRALSLRACARRAGVSHAAPKHHFRDIAELLAEVSARSFDRLTLLLQQAGAAAGDDPTRHYVAVARTYVQFALKYPSHFRLMFRSDAMAGQHPVLEAAANRTFAEMASSVTRLLNQPDVTPESLRERTADRELQNAILLAWSQIHGYTQLLLEGQFAAFAEAEGLQRFLERTVLETTTRMSALLQIDRH
ncbi:MAG: TetR/AcrR family transcriptional regulator [Pseudomonadales bacterium]|nr:TetR/AcrR family transcriptional regulator [Pseudomonadales bacterium]